MDNIFLKAKTSKNNKTKTKTKTKAKPDTYYNNDSDSDSGDSNINSFLLNGYSNKNTNTNNESNSVKDFDLNKETEQDNFPSIGGGNNVANNVKPMSFSDALNKKLPKANVEDKSMYGWMILKKGCQPFYHPKSKERINFELWLKEYNKDMEYYKWYELLERHAREEEIKYLLDGPEYIQSWEDDEYLRKRENEYKREIEENDSDNHNSDNDYTTETDF